MAKANGKKKGNRSEVDNQYDESDADLEFAGFEEVKMSRADGFFVREKGNKLAGTLMDSFTTNKGRFGPKTIHKVRLSGKFDCKISNEDNEVTTISEGIVAIDETGYLKKLGDIPQGTKIIIACLGKDGENQEDPWIFKVFKDTKSRPAQRRRGSDDADDIPF